MRRCLQSEGIVDVYHFSIKKSNIYPMHTTTTTTSTTVKTSTTTTTVVTTTTTSTCDDIYINELCDWGYSNIAEYNTIMTGMKVRARSIEIPIAFAMYYYHV